MFDEAATLEHGDMSYAIVDVHGHQIAPYRAPLALLAPPSDKSLFGQLDGGVIDEQGLNRLRSLYLLTLTGFVGPSTLVGVLALTFVGPLTGFVLGTVVLGTVVLGTIVLVP
jgi:hypothetical protein